MMFQARDAGPLQVYRGDPLQRGAGRPRQALLPSSEYSPCYVSLSFFHSLCHLWSSLACLHFFSAD